MPVSLHPPSAYATALRSSVRVDWSNLELVAALRCTAGVAVPLLVGFLFNHPTVSAFGAIGAVSVGFGSFRGAYRRRAAAMVIASLAMTVSIFIGSVAGASGVAVTVATAIVGLGGGLLTALGPAGAFIGLQAVVAVVIAGGFPSGPEEAAIRAAAVLGGGLLQTALVAVVWPFKRFDRERRAIAVVYRTLADYAGTLTSTAPGAPEPHTLAATASPVEDPQPWARATEVLTFVALLDEAERIRSGLAAVALRHAAILASDAACASEFASLVSGVLTEIATALESGRAPRDPGGRWRTLDTCVPALRGEPAFESVLGRLRAAWRTATSAADDPAPDHDEPVSLPAPRTLPEVRDTLLTLRANLTLESSALRHALRLAVTVTLATALAHALGLERGYWMALTALIVLRPEFHDTVAVGIARTAGTLAGAAIATAIVWFHEPGPGMQMILILVFVYGCYALFRINYALFAACLTGYVIFLLMLSGVGELTAATSRAAYTIAGGAMAVLAYTTWPTWTGRSTPAAIAALIDAHRAYVGALLAAAGNPATFDPQRVSALRSRARLARSNAEAVVERMLGEPPSRRGVHAPTAVGLLAALRRHALAALSLHSGLEQGWIAPAPGLAGFRGQVDEGLARLAEAVREGRSAAAMPPLRQTERALPRDAVAAIGAEADVMVDAINAMADLLGDLPRDA